MRPVRVLILVSLASSSIPLASCGRVNELRPAAGQSLPVKPLMARTTPTPAELLTPPSYARPVRVDDLVTRSQPRAADPFDLPPPTGGAAPPMSPTTPDKPATDPAGVAPKG